jgi:hypothetical protein
MRRPRTDPQAVAEALAAVDRGDEPDVRSLRSATRHLLVALAASAPGRSVEVRVPPYGVVQCIPGPRHTRGTPPNVVECEPTTWLLLATGRLTWSEAVAAGRVRASGTRADLSRYLPVPGAGDEPADG